MIVTPSAPGVPVTADGLLAALRAMAAGADTQHLVSGNLILSLSDIVPQASPPNSWTVRAGFTGVSDTQRSAISTTFYILLTQRYQQVQMTAAGQTPITISGTQMMGSVEGMATSQDCADGQQIAAADQCPAVADSLVDFALPATASTSSTPLVVIIAPVVAGVLLLALVMVAVLVVRRRRADVVKTHVAAETNEMSTRV